MVKPQAGPVPCLSPDCLLWRMCRSQAGREERGACLLCPHPCPLLSGHAQAAAVLCVGGKRRRGRCFRGGTGQRPRPSWEAALRENRKASEPAAQRWRGLAEAAGPHRPCERSGVPAQGQQKTLQGRGHRVNLGCRRSDGSGWNTALVQASAERQPGLGVLEPDLLSELPRELFLITLGQAAPEP